MQRGSAVGHRGTATCVALGMVGLTQGGEQHEPEPVKKPGNALAWHLAHRDGPTARPGLRLLRFGWVCIWRGRQRNVWTKER